MQYTRWVVIFQQGNNLSHLNKCVCVLSVRFYVVFCSRFFCSVWMLSNLHIWLFSWFLPLVHRALVTSKLFLLYTSYIAIHQLSCTPNKLWFEFSPFSSSYHQIVYWLMGGVHVCMCECVDVWVFVWYQIITSSVALLLLPIALEEGTTTLGVPHTQTCTNWLALTT